MKSIDAIVRLVTLRELRLLRAVARRQHPQSSTRNRPHTTCGFKSITDLEETLGVQLFDRNNRGVEPTPHGRIFVRRALAVFEEMRQAVEELNFLSDSTSREVRIGGTPAMCGGLLSHAVNAMDGKRPGIRYHVVELETERLAAEVRAHSIDIGLGRKPVIRADDNISFERLFDDPAIYCGGRQASTSGRRAIALDESADQRWVLPMPQGPLSPQLQGAFERLGVQPLSIVTTMSMLVRYELLATNRFITVLHGSLLQFGNMPSYLRVLPVELSGGMPSGLSRVKNRTLSPATELFIERDGASSVPA